MAGCGHSAGRTRCGRDQDRALAGDQACHIGRYRDSMVRAYNRGKRSIALDLKSARGLHAGLRLMSAAMVASLGAFIHCGDPTPAEPGQQWQPWPSSRVFDATADALRIPTLAGH